MKVQRSKEQVIRELNHLRSLVEKIGIPTTSSQQEHYTLLREQITDLQDELEGID